MFSIISCQLLFKSGLVKSWLAANDVLWDFMLMLKPPPCPLELFVNHPKVKYLKYNQYGLFCRLLHSFWIDGIPIPQTDTQLMQRAGGTPAFWKLARPGLMEALEAVWPSVVSEYHKRQAKYAKQVQSTVKMLEIRKTKRLERMIAQAKPFHEKADGDVRVANTHAPKFHNPRIDMKSRAEAVIRDGQAKEKGGSLREK